MARYPGVEVEIPYTKSASYLLFARQSRSIVRVDVRLLCANAVYAVIGPRAQVADRDNVLGAATTPILAADSELAWYRTRKRKSNKH